MGIPAYSLDRTSTRIKADGTECYITLESKETADRGFRANLEGLSAHVILLQQVCAEMARRLLASGKAKEIQTKIGTEPMRVLSFQIAPFEDRRAASLRIQTEDGPLVTLSVQADSLHALRRYIDELGPLNADSQSAKKH